MQNNLSKIALILLLSLGFTLGCGQKGALYLPDATMEQAK